jgi:sporulation protein YlmC with PRC-barrel domain
MLGKTQGGVLSSPLPADHLQSRSVDMRHTVTVVLIGVMVVVAVGALSAQIAGSTTTGVTVEELKTIARGWSARKQILGKSVYNDKDDKVGDVEDLIIAPDSSVSYAIIGVGGFLGLGERQVAIPVNRFTAQKTQVLLSRLPRSGMVLSS